MKAVGVPAGGLSTELAFHHWNFSSQNDKLGHNSIWNQAWLMVHASKHSRDIKINIFRNNCFNYLNYNTDKNKYSIQVRTHYIISKARLQREEKLSTATNQINNWIWYLQSENKRSGVWIMALFDDVQSCRLLHQDTQLPFCVCYQTLFSAVLLCFFFLMDTILKLYVRERSIFPYRDDLDTLKMVEKHHDKYFFYNNYNNRINYVSF